ncbi:MAG: glycosyltransferase [Coriobacteriia bacterium]|nr:glycosyltransferase [Coriobacteriia bacterium]
MDIAVLIPAHNEAAAIAETVQTAFLIPGVTRVVVVDDGSEDETDQRAEAAGAKVVRIFGNMGKGAALEAGAMRIENADIILLLDGDLGQGASQAELLLEPLLAGRADMTVSLAPSAARNAGLGWAEGLARWGIRRLAGENVDFRVPLSSQRALTNRCLEAVRPFSAGYGVEVGVTVRALRAGFRIEEVETGMTGKPGGKNLQGLITRGRRLVHVGLALTKLARKSRRHDPRGKRA